MSTTRRPYRDERPSGEPAPKVRPGHEGPLRAEILSVGRELLRGLIADRNAREIASALGERGIDVQRITVVDDEEETLVAVLREILDRSPNLVVISGGLGPAADDRTLAALARILGRPLTLHPAARALVESAYERMARERLIPSGGLNAAREKLCRLPVGTTALPNATGLAPGVLCRLPGGTTVVSLPGQPAEAQGVLGEALLLLGEPAPRRYRARLELESPTPDESSLGGLLERLAEEFPGVWISSRPPNAYRKGQHAVVRIEATATTAQQATQAATAARQRLLALVSGAW